MKTDLVRYDMVYSTPSEMLKMLGTNLKEVRLRLNISQQVAADRSGISLKAVRNIEGGLNASTESLVKYCRTLRKTDWLLTLAPPELDPNIFDQASPEKKRLRARRLQREVRHG